MGWDGEIGHGTFLQDITFWIFLNNSLKPIKNQYILTTTQLRFLSVFFNGVSHMFINREGPTQSSIAQHFLECGCWLIRATYSYELNITHIVLNQIPLYHIISQHITLHSILLHTYMYTSYIYIYIHMMFYMTTCTSLQYIYNIHIHTYICTYLAYACNILNILGIHLPTIVAVPSSEMKSGAFMGILMFGFSTQMMAAELKFMAGGAWDCIWLTRTGWDMKGFRCSTSPKTTLEKTWHCSVPSQHCVHRKRTLKPSIKGAYESISINKLQVVGPSNRIFLTQKGNVKQQKK